MHREERQARPEERQPERRDRPALVIHAAGHLRQPVVDPAEDREDRRAEDDEVEVRDDEVRVCRRLVERDLGEHDPGEAAEHEERDEAADEEQRRPKLRPARRHGHQPRVDLDRRRDDDHHRRRREDHERRRREPRREHVVRPDAEADERDEQLGERDERERDHLPLRERGDDGGRDPHRRQDDDVDLWMAEQPEEVLP